MHILLSVFGLAHMVLLPLLRLPFSFLFQCFVVVKSMTFRPLFGDADHHVGTPQIVCFVTFFDLEYSDKLPQIFPPLAEPS
jgi:hypothetical protein